MVRVRELGFHLDMIRQDSQLRVSHLATTRRKAYLFSALVFPEKGESQYGNGKHGDGITFQM